MKVLSRAVRQKINKVKGMQIGKEEVKLVLLVNDIILCTENPKHSTTKKKYYNYSMNSSMLEDKTLIC